MPKNIVIGSDGSTQAEGALHFSGALARALGARVVVATAYAHMPPLRGGAGPSEDVQLGDAEEIARRGAAALKGIPDVQARAVSAGTIAEGLHRVAEDEHADLLVIATSSRRRIAGYQPGSVSEHVVHHSPCPVAVVPPQHREPRFARIGVAVDGTPAARAALTFAFDFGERVSEQTPTFRLLHVLPQAGVFGRTPQPGLQPPPVRLLDPQQLDHLAAETAAHGAAEILTGFGDPAEELVRMSEGLDVLVCGSRDRGALKRLVLGSVSTHVVRHATCAVIVIPAPEVTGHSHTTGPAEPASA